MLFRIAHILKFMNCLLLKFPTWNFGFWNLEHLVMENLNKMNKTGKNIDV